MVTNYLSKILSSDHSRAPQRPGMKRMTRRHGLVGGTPSIIASLFFPSSFCMVNDEHLLDVMTLPQTSVRPPRRRSTISGLETQCPATFSATMGDRTKSERHFGGAFSPWANSRQGQVHRAETAENDIRPQEHQQSASLMHS